MKTINVEDKTFERFIAYSGLIQQAYKEKITADRAVNELLDKSWKHFQEDYKIEATKQ